MTIIYTEKGEGLHQAVRAAGHWLSEVDGVWRSDDDAAVQAIIDNYTGATDKIAAANVLYAEKIAAGYIVTVATAQHTMPLDAEHLQHYDAEALVAINQGQPGIPAWDPNEFWPDINGAPVTIADATTAVATATSIRAYFKALGKNLITLVGQLNAATTWTAVSAIDITAGWPTNP